VVIGGLLLGERGVFMVAGIAALGVIFLGFADMNGLTATFMAQRTGIDDISIISLLLFLSAGVMRLLLTRANNSIQRAKENEQAQIEANKELRNLQSSLEERVENRTRELQETSVQLDRRAKDFEAISDISRSMTSIREVEILLPTVARLISERFGFYHTGIFILDEANQYAMLRATNSPGGKRMMEREHKLKVEPGSLVGYASSRGLPRIALDVGEDAVFFNNPDLPDTRSEIALPLIVGNQTIGVLDVQSTESGAFTEQDVNILSTLANQVAIAIQNARFFDETRRALAESERIYQQFVEQGWQRITSEKPNLGYQYSGEGIKPLDAPLSGPKAQVASQTQADILIPIKLRGQSIGVLNIRSADAARKWDEDELALIQAAADRAALALENARLLEDSQRRASKERTISEFSARISAATDMDTILQTAVEEIGHAIGSSEVSIRFRTQEN
jgi:GAF domain-containing protein